MNQRQPKIEPTPKRAQPLFGSCWVCLFCHLRGLLAGHGGCGLGTIPPKTGHSGRGH